MSTVAKEIDDKAVDNKGLSFAQVPSEDSALSNEVFQGGINVQMRVLEVKHNTLQQLANCMKSIYISKR
ncbi:hypothetical protein K4F52_008062 [Lecanicillium sp. MT-2017a]|nr:hypothetical protein K4F52_008062 [Lecanicillium sp. MT-2017a]